MLLILILLALVAILLTAGLVAAACYVLGLVLGTLRLRMGQP